MSKPISVTLVGATGLTGSATLDALSADVRPFDITTITRRAISKSPSNSSTTYTPKIMEDLFQAPSGPVATAGGLYISCLGTTRGAAGGFDKQVKIDLDLNRDLAQKAKEDGATSMILVSSGGASSSSFFGYAKMKGQLEEAVREMGFEHCVILRPGLLMGTREEMRLPEYTSQKIFAGLSFIGVPMNALRVEGTQVGKCIAQLASNLPSEKVAILSNSEIIKLAADWDAAQPTKAP